MRIIITTPNHQYKEFEGEADTLNKVEWDRVMRDLIYTEEVNEREK